MLDGRDAILAADTILFGSAHHQAIWHVFASRGMGDLASTVDENDLAPVVDGTVPAGLECPTPVAPTGLSAAVQNDNQVRLDYSAAGAAAPEPTTRVNATSRRALRPAALSWPTPNPHSGRRHPPDRVGGPLDHHRHQYPGQRQPERNAQEAGTRGQWGLGGD